MIENAKSGIQLNSIILMESIFYRGSIELEPDMKNFKMDIKVDSQEKGSFVKSNVTVKIGDIKNRKADEFAIQISMVGVFERLGSTPLTSEEFKNINAPAIVYPYIRQLVRTITLDASMNPVLLPVMNFQKLYISKQENKPT
mgnify:CR=1 FL=1